ncbi:ArgS-related anticodon-binding protein NrtL [Streptomyces sp. NPDC097619]|uniref:ArgS-related anticodon-binding protein NrtL n=1 Tax=Streptomyces sp. NPDC097619 TaxID=3157228 RepID=UPI003331822B
MIPADLSRTVVRAVRGAVADGELRVRVPERLVVERTRPGGVGEYASGVALRLAKEAGRPPREVAEVLARQLAGTPGLDRVEITGPGFLNFTLAAEGRSRLVAEVLDRGPCYGYAAGVEVPQAPPLAAADRAEVVASALARILHSQGHGQATTPAAEGPAAEAPTPTPTPVAPTPLAPVAARDGDVRARFGDDAARWAMLAVPAKETPVFGPGLLVQDEGNPVFLVRYAHSRARALTRNAADLGFRSDPALPPGSSGSDASLGDGPDPRPLLDALAEYPLVLEAAAHHRAPERVVRHLIVIADALLDFQYGVLPRGGEKPSAAHRSRLALVEAAGTVLAGGLSLLGVDAPELL